MSIPVFLDNRKALIGDCSDEDFVRLDNFFSYSDDKARFNPLFKKFKKDGTRIYDGYKRLIKRRCIPSGLFRVYREQIKTELGIQFQVTRRRPIVRPFLEGIGEAGGKYTYQDDCVDAMCNAIQDGGGSILSGTGTGKTSLTARFFSKVSYSCLFVVDSLDLLYQAQKEISMWLGEPVGIVGDSQYIIERVTIATAQTLSKHIKDRRFMKWFTTVQVVVVDELHEQLSKRSFKIMNAVKPIACYGLTATLNLNQKSVRFRAYAFCGPLIFEFPYAEGVERKVLTEGSALQLAFETTDANLQPYQYHYKFEVLDNQVKAEALGWIIDLMLAHGRYVMVLTDKPEHIRRLSTFLSDIPHKVAYGAIKKDERIIARDTFEQGDVRLLIANRVFKKGVDLKRVDVIIDVAEMASKNDTKQKFGRGVRLHEDKTALMYLDFGTQGKGRFGKRTRSRKRALIALGINVQTVRVATPLNALQVVTKYLKIEEKKYLIA